jgi:dienelactone hydrolase
MFNEEQVVEFPSMNRSLLPIAARRIPKLLTLSLLLAATSAPAADVGGLPRAGFLGTQLAPAADGRPTVRAVVPGSTGAALHVLGGDVIVAINGSPTTSVAEVVAAAGKLRAGKPVTIEVRRASKTVHLAGQTIGKPLEHYPNATVTYGSFPFRGGKIRDILAMPASSPQAPVVFLLPGFSCISIEPAAPTAAYRVLAARLTAAGIGYYRAEKPGLGDSVGGPQCADITFDTELDAFRTAYRHLTDDLHIPRERIIMLGHSLGALEAPLLADEKAPRGIIVYGAVLRNWGDYHQQVGSFQGYLIDGSDPGKVYDEGEHSRPVFQAYYFDKKSPAAIAQEHPELAASVKEVLGWDGKDRAVDRNWRFMQALAGLNLPAAWRGARTNVLSLYGGADIVALFDTDQKMIADIAEHSRARSGTYIEVPSADHGMMNVGSRRQARADAAAGRQGSPAFDEDVATAMIGWIRSIMGKPPVS